MAHVTGLPADPPRSQGFGGETLVIFEEVIVSSGKRTPVEGFKVLDARARSLKGTKRERNGLSGENDDRNLSGLKDERMAGGDSAEACQACHVVVLAN